MTAVSEIQ